MSSVMNTSLETTTGHCRGAWFKRRQAQWKRPVPLAGNRPSSIKKMLDDQPVATAISPDVVFASGQRRPATLAGLQPGNWPLPPPVPGDWSNAVSEDLVRIRQLILSDRER